MYLLAIPNSPAHPTRQQAPPERPSRPPQRPPPPSSQNHIKKSAYKDDSDSEEESYGSHIHSHSPSHGSGTMNQGAASQQSAGALFSSLKGGAFSIMRNVKDASTKVMETVQA